jgi:hypothetical protein
MAGIQSGAVVRRGTELDVSGIRDEETVAGGVGRERVIYKAVNHDVSI